MDNDKNAEIRLDADYWEMLKATARLVDTWPEWKTGEYSSITCAGGRNPEQSNQAEQNVLEKAEQNGCW
jgi:hypothetical protein